MDQDQRLTWIAQQTRPRVKRWYGRRGGSTRTVYVCYLCDKVIDSESANHRHTKHVDDSIREHRDHHLEEFNQIRNHP